MKECLSLNLHLRKILASHSGTNLLQSSFHVKRFIKYNNKNKINLTILRTNVLLHLILTYIIYSKLKQLNLLIKLLSNYKNSRFSVLQTKFTKIHLLQQPS